MNWFKQLFGIGDKMQTDIHGLPYVQNLVPIPDWYKPPRGKDISEPVFAMLNAWKDNSKRFVLLSETSMASLETSMASLFSIRTSYRQEPIYELTVLDIQSRETFKFSLSLQNGSYIDCYDSCHFIFKHFARHRIYPVLDSEVINKPSWMTQDELDLIIETVKPYYLKRVNRYKDIVESRIDRTRKANNLKSEIAKQKERDRLTGIYK